MSKKKTKQKKDEYFLCEGELLRVVDEGLFAGAEKVEVPRKKCCFKWKGLKIPVEIHRQIISFFYEGYKKTNSENLVWLFYDMDNPEWLAWAPPQICNGMTVDADNKDEEFKKQRAEIPERFVQMGTYHHHCGGSAFASGTDNDDEIDRDGIHITIGGIGQHKNPLTIDVRCCFHEVKYGKIDPTDVIDTPKWISEAPKSMQRGVMNTYITLPKKDEEYPKQWLENAKKKSYQVYRGATTGGTTPTRQAHFLDWDTTKKKTEPDTIDSHDQRDLFSLCQWFSESSHKVDEVDKLFEDYREKKLSPNDEPLFEVILQEIDMDAKINEWRAKYLFRTIDVESYLKYYESLPRH